MVSAFIVFSLALLYAQACCSTMHTVVMECTSCPNIRQPSTPVQTPYPRFFLHQPRSHPPFAFIHAIVSCMQGWLKQLQLPSGLNQQGPAPAYAALSALCAYLKRMRAEQELASGMQQTWHR